MWDPHHAEGQKVSATSLPERADRCMTHGYDLMRRYKRLSLFDPGCKCIESNCSSSSYINVVELGFVKCLDFGQVELREATH